MTQYREIPLFASDEAEALRALLGEHGIEVALAGYRTAPGGTGYPQFEALGYGSWEDHHYALRVRREQFDDAVQLLKAHFDIQAMSPFTGACPSCGEPVMAALECPGCRLHLAAGIPPNLSNHPFAKFLTQAGLL